MNYPKCPQCEQRIELPSGFCGCTIRPNDPTPEEIAAIVGAPLVDDSLQEVDREIAARLAGLTRENYPYPIVGIECNGRVIPNTMDWFLPSPNGHTPHCMSRSRGENARCGRIAEELIKASE